MSRSGAPGGGGHAEFAENGLAQRPFVIASEYERLTRAWLQRRGLQATFAHSYGATEVFRRRMPTASSTTWRRRDAAGERSRGGRRADALLHRLYAHPRALDAPEKRARIENLILLLRSVLDARQRVMLEVDVSADRLEAVVEVLPCMREPTMAPLHGDQGFALKAAVPAPTCRG